MRALLAGATGLALAALAGAALAQDGAPPPTEPSQVAAPAPVDGQAPIDGQAPAAPDMDAPAAPQASASDTSEVVVSGWEGDVPAAYRGSRTPVANDVLEAWLAQPRSLLDDNPRGGREMAQFVRSLVGMDNRTVLALVNLVKMPDVRDAQVGAVAEGLAGAMRDAEVPAPRYAAYIQWAVAQSGSSELIEAFERASGADEDQTAAIGAAGGAGSPGSGSLSGGGSPGISGPVGADSTVATSGGLTGGGGGGSISFSEGDRLLSGASGRLVVCRLDASPTGCQVVF